MTLRKATTHKPIGILIRDLRHAAGLTQVQLAARAGCTQPVVSDLERGRGDPLWSTAVRFLGLLGVDLPAKLFSEIRRKIQK